MSILATVGALILIALSSVIAFVVTCFPLGVVAYGGNVDQKTAIMWFYLPWVAGVVVAIGVGYGIYRLTFGSKRRYISPPQVNEMDRQ